jgi:hypothetical protein
MKFLNVLLVVTASILLSGCYGGIQISSDIGWGANYNADSSQVVFYKFHHIFRHPKGLLRFPDGGISKSLYRNISLFTYSFKDSSLNRIYDFGSFYGNRSRWETTAFFINNDVIFNLAPLHALPKEENDSSMTPTPMAEKSLNRWFLYKHAQDVVVEIEPMAIDSSAIRKVSLSLIGRETEHISLLEWGLNFDEIYPQTKRERLAEIESFENCRAYTLAIIELMANDLTAKDIDRLIRRINRYVDSKEGHERSRLLHTRDVVVGKLEGLPQYK